MLAGLLIQKPYDRKIEKSIDFLADIA